jgi:hypothetical protein
MNNININDFSYQKKKIIPYNQKQNFNIGGNYNSYTFNNYYDHIYNYPNFKNNINYDKQFLNKKQHHDRYYDNYSNYLNQDIHEKNYSCNNKDIYQSKNYFFQEKSNLSLQEDSNHSNGNNFEKTKKTQLDSYCRNEDKNFNNINNFDIKYEESSECRSNFDNNLNHIVSNDSFNANSTNRNYTYSISDKKKRIFTNNYLEKSTSKDKEDKFKYFSNKTQESLNKENIVNKHLNSSHKIFLENNEDNNAEQHNKPSHENKKDNLQNKFSIIDFTTEKDEVSRINKESKFYKTQKSVKNISNYLKIEEIGEGTYGRVCKYK